MADNKRPNTFGDYKFPDWVPEHTREIIRDFWGQMGRTHKDWLDSPAHQGLMETCHHGPNPNGFGMPPNGATAEFFMQDWNLQRDQGIERYEIVRGRYLHRWNNMGSLIDEDGKDWIVSTCDRWVRWWASDDERKAAGF
jgi:hypothetical protein